MMMFFTQFKHKHARLANGSARIASLIIYCTTEWFAGVYSSTGRSSDSERLGRATPIRRIRLKTALLDTNVLLALAWPNHQHHAVAHRWFAKHTEQGWATCALAPGETLVELIRT
ncbi:MAG: hypothetical protein JWM99_3540 [Verrucomicrobiales bacterium]|nr:hypothetical protein [Verrucomicrobiales bacterium]